MLNYDTQEPRVRIEYVKLYDTKEPRVRIENVELDTKEPE